MADLHQGEHVRELGLPHPGQGPGCGQQLPVGEVDRPLVVLVNLEE